MKKILILIFVALLVLTSCGDGGKKEVVEKELTVLTSNDLKTMDYVVSNQQPNQEILANLVDGLVENTPSGKLVGAIAESWTISDDKKVYTFKLRDGVKWVTSTGEEYGAVTAEDFVTGLRHAVEFDSETTELLLGVIKGFTEYTQSDYSDAAWEKVGVKALDEKTLEYTLEEPVPYFLSMTTYSVLFPINKAFLESKGEGCALGKPNKDACSFGSLQFDSILYNGGFILVQNDAKSVQVLEKNRAYWDADNVFLSKITRIYTEGQDTYEAIKGLENGTYSVAGLNASWEDYEQYLEKYKDNAIFNLPNSTTFGIVFNYNRQVFNQTNYATDKAMADNTRKAVLNENFRKALRAAYDVVAKMAVSNPVELALSSTRNINNFPDAGSTSDGKLYYDLVIKHHADMTGKHVDLNDGQYAWLDKDAALAYIEAAKAEGIQFPVHLDVLVPETSDRLTKEAQSMKKSIEENTNGQIIIEPVLRSLEIVRGIAFDEQDPANRDYDINTFAGWGPDYSDPKTYVQTFSAEDGTYLVNMGLRDGVAEDKALKEQIGLLEYERLYREADKILDDLDARYDAFAKADAYLIAHAIFIPTQQQTRSQRITKVVPFSGLYSPFGVSELKFKSIQLQDELVTVSQYEEAYKKWEEDRRSGK